jgi:hypothetical protein
MRNLSGLPSGVRDRLRTSGITVRFTLQSRPIKEGGSDVRNSLAGGAHPYQRRNGSRCTFFLRCDRLKFAFSARRVPPQRRRDHDPPRFKHVTPTSSSRPYKRGWISNRSASTPRSPRPAPSHYSQPIRPSTQHGVESPCSISAPTVFASTPSSARGALRAGAFIAPLPCSGERRLRPPISPCVRA